jgi:hypothetical protein
MECRMKHTPRKMSQFAAVAACAAALWIAAPAKAAEMDVPAKQSVGAPPVKVASVPARHHRHHNWPRYRVASWYTSHLRYADAEPAGWSGYYWSPHPVLLMVGIAF